MDDPDQELSWLITDFKARVVDVAHAIVVSADGIPLAVSDMIRPDSVSKLCAITSGLVGLADGYQYVDDHDDVFCAVLTGAGGQFSSGADLKAMGQPSTSEHVRNRQAEEPGMHWNRPPPTSRYLSPAPARASST